MKIAKYKDMILESSRNDRVKSISDDIEDYFIELKDDGYSIFK
jgi:hypothetical protein